jgi:DNA-binding SARP family transcriptional activator
MAMAEQWEPPQRVRSSRGGAGRVWSIQMLGGFSVTGRTGVVALPESTWRLVALLALTQQPMLRSRVAGTLWGDKDEDHAHASLRSVLWRLNQGTPGLVEADGRTLRLASGTRVDLADLHELAARLERRLPFDPDAIDAAMCCADLLPDWDDAFIDDHRELVRQLRLRTLESVARRLCETGHWGHALRLALLAVRQAPLRESAHQVVLEIHVAEGNVSEALRHYRALSGTLWEELGIRPSERLRSIVAPYRAPQVAD